MVVECEEFGLWNVTELGCKTLFCHLSTAWPWASYLSLDLSSVNGGNCPHLPWRMFWELNESMRVKHLHGAWHIRMQLLLSHFSRVRLCVTPEMAAHQAPPSLGFSRQEHWSGLPFPSPMHEREKWKWSRSVMSNSLQSHGLQPTRLLCPWDFPGKSTGVGCHCLLWAHENTQATNVGNYDVDGVR